ncbi:5-methylthioadenosine/S-adenosylhomocysteine deaminase [mine drainage metagenome]|uniref:5-methylthioadenosine/S-adenosylhomocysteine deaminase n=1 Tax=mine drainage metagenome TaxID=410659 RepID=T0YC39_9ZZZZ
MSILIKGALIATQDKRRAVVKGNVLIDGNRIAYVGRKAPKASDVVDGRGKAVIPGLINTHTHVAMAHMKGLLDDIGLDGFLERTFKYDSSRTDNGIYNSAMLGILEMINSGTTSFLDLYYSEDIVAKAAEKAGIRAFLSWVTLDDEFTTQTGSPLRNAEKFITKYGKNRLVTPSIGIQGVYVAGDETMLKAKEIADRHGTLLHMHLAETRSEVTQVAKKFGERPAAHIGKLGLADDRLVAAHCIWLNGSEVRMLGNRHANISWNQVSNSKLASGMAKVVELASSGANMTIGTDSNGSNNSLNMLESMKFSALAAKSEYDDAASITAQQVFDMATVNAAKALGRGDLGSVERDKTADLVIMDINAPNMRPTSSDNLINNVVYSSNPSNVCCVIIDGKIVKRGPALGVHLGENLKFV